MLILLVFLCLQHVVESRYPCLNDGEPVLLGQNGNEFRCECLAGYFGPFCEYQDTSQTADPKSNPKASCSMSLPCKSADFTTFHRLHWLIGKWRPWLGGHICQFAALHLLPVAAAFIDGLRSSRALLVLEEVPKSSLWSHHYGNPQPSRGGIPHQGQQNQNQLTPPPQYWAAIAEDGRQQDCWLGVPNNDRLWPINGQRMAHPQGHRERRRRSESPVTEVTVQLPASICRPIHGTRSAGPLVLHQSQSLTLNEFHELLLGIQREMMAQQRAEYREQQRHHQQQQGQQQQQIAAPALPSSLIAPPELPPPPPPSLLEPPPNYDLALTSTCPLGEDNPLRHF